MKVPRLTYSGPRRRSESQLLYSQSSVTGVVICCEAKSVITIIFDGVLFFKYSGGSNIIFFALGGSPRHQQGASSRRVIRMQSSLTTLRRDPHFAPPTRGLFLVVRLLHSDAKYFCTEPPPLFFHCRLWPVFPFVAGFSHRRLRLVVIFLLSFVGTSTGRVYPAAATFRPQLQPGRAPGRLLHQGQADHYYEASAPG